MVYGKGYLGKGEYTSKKDGEMTIQYQYWNNMLKRVYSEAVLKTHPSYKDCEVCEEWLDFQVFAKWFDENYYTMGNDKMCLDKDILFKNNKIYSPDTCVFVPMRINSLFTKRQNDRGKYPIGISDVQKCTKLRVRCNIIKDGVAKSKYLGVFDTIDIAFSHYKTFKEDYIKEIANDYKDVIPENLYNAMMNYVVEIDD